jgi:hypothetical protein
VTIESSGQSKKSKKDIENFIFHAFSFHFAFSFKSRSIVFFGGEVDSRFPRFPLLEKMPFQVDFHHLTSNFISTFLPNEGKTKGKLP